MVRPVLHTLPALAAILAVGCNDSAPAVGVGDRDGEVSELLDGDVVDDPFADVDPNDIDPSELDFGPGGEVELPDDPSETDWSEVVTGPTTGPRVTAVEGAGRAASPAPRSADASLYAAAVQAGARTAARRVDTASKALVVTVKGMTAVWGVRATQASGASFDLTGLTIATTTEGEETVHTIRGTIGRVVGVPAAGLFVPAVAGLPAPAQAQVFFLQGEPGDAGARGEKGDKGDKGDKGEKGDAGAAAPFTCTAESCRPDKPIVFDAGRAQLADYTTTGDLNTRLAGYARVVTTVERRTVTTAEEFTQVWNEFGGVRFSPTGGLVIGFKPGTYDFEGRMEFSHPEGDRIGIFGDAADPSEVVLLSLGVLVRNGANLGALAGVTIRNVDPDAGVVNAGITAFGGSTIVLDRVIVEGFSFGGLLAEQGGRIVRDLGSSGAPLGRITVRDADYAVLALTGGFVDFTDGLVEAPRTWGLAAKEGGVILAHRAAVRDSGRFGLLADSNGTISAENVTISGSAGFAAVSLHGGVNLLPGVQIENCAAGVAALGGGIGAVARAAVSLREGTDGTAYTSYGHAPILAAEATGNLSVSSEGHAPNYIIDLPTPPPPGAPVRPSPLRELLRPAR